MSALMDVACGLCHRRDYGKVILGVGIDPPIRSIVLPRGWSQLRDGQIVCSEKCRSTLAIGKAKP